jgi:multidrug efflux pump subunit AcrA (membrane-fusion protein)
MGFTEVLLGVGSAVSAIGNLNQAEAQANAAEANAKAAQYNANIAAQNAAAERAAGTERERRQRVAGEAAVGRIRAAYGASGVTLDGSALYVLQDAIVNAELDALTIKYDSDLRALGYSRESTLDTMRANSYADSVDSIMAGGYLSAMGSLLGGFARTSQANTSLALSRSSGVLITEED